MSVLRSNVDQTKNFIIARDQNHGRAPYVYGGSLTTDPHRGTDCSEIWQTVLEMVFGRWNPGRQNEGATTESYRYIPVGGVGPFGTIKVARLADVPRDAAAILAFHHGPGGGANSHVWGQLDGLPIESGGSKGVVTGDPAMRIDSNYANAWAYLPGPIVNNTNAEVSTLAQGSLGPAVMTLQEQLNKAGAAPQLDVDGDYGVLTTAAVMWYQNVNQLNKDPKGVAGPETLRHIGLNVTVPAPPSGEDGAKVLAEVMGNVISLDKYREYWPGFRDCVLRSNCATPKRINMMVAQLGHECVGFKDMKEIWGPTPQQLTYQGRMGNNNPGDGERYMGRGAIMVTGKDNYRNLSQWAHLKGYVNSPTFFVDDPAKLETPQYCFLGAIWYWTIARPKINEYCDWDNLEDSLIAVTKAINGGTYGLDNRRNRLNKARSMDLAPIMRGGSIVPPPIVIPPVVQPPSQAGSGFVYLSKDQELTVFRAAEKLLTQVKSNSPTAKPGEGTIGDHIDLIRYIDGNVHPLLQMLLIWLGDPNEAKNLDNLANVSLATYPDKAYGRKMAQEMLKKASTSIAPEPVSTPVARVEAAPSYQPPADYVVHTPVEKPVEVNPANQDEVIGQTFRALKALDLQGELSDADRVTYKALIPLLGVKVEENEGTTE